MSIVALLDIGFEILQSLHLLLLHSEVCEIAYRDYPEFNFRTFEPFLVILGKIGIILVDTLNQFKSL